MPLTYALKLITNLKWQLISCTLQKLIWLLIITVILQILTKMAFLCLQPENLLNSHTLWEYRTYTGEQKHVNNNFQYTKEIYFMQFSSISVCSLLRSKYKRTDFRLNIEKTIYHVPVRAWVASQEWLSMWYFEIKDWICVCSYKMRFSS